MPRPNLNSAQQSLVRLLVKVHEAGYHGEFFWYATFGGCRFEFNGEAEPIEASKSDILALNRERMLALNFDDGGDAATCQLEQPAFEAVKRNFGVTDRQLVLEAIYSLTEGSLTAAPLASAVAAKAGLSQERTNNAWQILSQAGLANGNSGNGNGPVMGITGRGVSAIEDHAGEQKMANPSHVYNFNGPGALVQFGSQSTATLIQNIAEGQQPELLAGLEDLRRQAVELRGNDVAIAQILDDLISAVEAGQTQTPMFKDKLQSFWKKANEFAQFVAAIATITQAAKGK
jgi:hypothetical protein